MNSLKAFFNRITQCAIDPASYRTLKGEGLGSAYWYLYRLLVLTSLVITLWLAAGLVHVMPQIKSVAHEIETTLPTLYPKEMILTFQSGALTTNVKEPYAIKVPAKWNEQQIGDDTDETDTDHANIAVFDTKASPEDYEKYNTFVLFTKNYAVGGRDNGELRMFPYAKFEENFVVTHEKYTKTLQMVFSKAKSLIPVLKVIMVVCFLLAPFVFAGVGLLSWMISLLIYSLILWFVSSMGKWGYTYGQIYRLSVFGATPAVILGMLFWLGGVTVPWVLQLFTLVWMWFVLKKLR